METKYTYKKSRNFFIRMATVAVFLLLGGLVSWVSGSKGWAITGWSMSAFLIWMMLRRNQKIAFQAIKAKERTAK